MTCQHDLRVCHTMATLTVAADLDGGTGRGMMHARMIVIDGERPLIGGARRTRSAPGAIARARWR